MRKILLFAILIALLLVPNERSEAKDILHEETNSTKIVIKQKIVHLKIGEVSKLSLTTEEGIKDIQWVSQKNDIVKVDPNSGKTKGLSSGLTTVLCKFIINDRHYTTKSLVYVDDIPVFFQQKLMAHALGGLEDAYIYSNSLEGLNQSLDKGFKLIETDLILTKDNKLVCFHGWNEATYKNTGFIYDRNSPVMNYDEFMKAKIQGRYTTIDIMAIVNCLKNNPDIYFELDLRTLNKNTSIKTAKELLDAFSGNELLLDRIIVQVGSKEMYSGIDSVYHFKNYQYFVHNNELKKIDALLAWLKENGFLSVAIQYKNLTKENIVKVKEKGIYLIAHTVDDSKEANKLLLMGVNIICTNFINFNEITYIN